MGTTPFVLTGLDIDLGEGIGMGFSMLHKLRARAAEALEEELLASYHKRTLERTSQRVFTKPLRKGSCKVGVITTNPACARAAKRAGADFIYVPAHNYRRGEAVIAGQLRELPSKQAIQNSAFLFCLRFPICLMKTFEEASISGIVLNQTSL